MAKVKKTKKVRVLPKKLSSLIGIALRDIRKAENDRMIINMGVWYIPNQDVVCKVDDGLIIDSYKTCSMCAAGSVMAYSLATERQKSRQLNPRVFRNNEKQLNAIDHLRQGEVSSAYLAIHGFDVSDEKLHKFGTIIPEYDRENPEPFHKSMKKLQIRLQKAGY